ncbi:MAG TPA: MBL fold metallo-hydrolase [Bacteroidales bacterium]|nr:MBL fold metallo-hydrolase [Bacteroidales bacterium]
MKIFPVNITNFKIDGGVMFGVVPKAMWQKKYPADEHNLCNWALRSLLIDTGDRRILIDNGFGDKQDEKYFRYFYLNGNDSLDKSLAKHGYTKDDITDMVITHLHSDHCGGGIRRTAEGKYETAFRNATYYVSRSQWEWSLDPNDREGDSFLKENILPIQESGQLQLIDHDTTLFPGFSVRLYDGHTMGQMIPFIEYEGKTIVFVSDLFPSVAHIPLPWIMAYDIQPMVTLKEKEDFLKEAAENQYVLFFQHDIFNECCTVKDTPKGIREDKIFTLSEMFSG